MDEPFRDSLKSPDSIKVLDLLDHRAGFKDWTWMGKCNWAMPQATAISSAHLSGGLKELHKTRIQALTDLCFQKRNTPPQKLNSAIDSNSSQNHSFPTIYSDLGYCLLARAAEMSRGFLGWGRLLLELNTRLGTDFSHASLLHSRARPRIPFYPYVSSESEEKNIELAMEFGGVNDTNANILASLSRPEFPLVSAHAGLLGSVVSVEKSLPWVARGATKWKKETENLHQYPENGLQRFSFGLDTPEALTSSASVPSLEFARDHWIAGHLGYTGTSFWLSITNPSAHGILLTNRTSHRLSYGRAVPRLLVLESLQDPRFSEDSSTLNTESDPPLIWTIQAGNLAPVSVEDCLEICHECSGERELRWDSHRIWAPSNVYESRRLVGQIAWKKL